MKLSELKAKIAEFEKDYPTDLDLAEVWVSDYDVDNGAVGWVPSVRYDDGTNAEGIRYADQPPTLWVVVDFVSSPPETKD